MPAPTAPPRPRLSFRNATLCTWQSHPPRPSLRRLPRQQIPPNPKHLPANHSPKPINLPRILLHLPSDQHSLQPTRLDGQLEQFLPLVLGQRRLLLLHPQRILLLPLQLPRLDLRLLAREGALVVLRVVLLGLVGFDAVEELVDGFFQEGVDAEVEVVEVRGQGVGGEVRVAMEFVEGGGEGEVGVGGRGGGELVEVGG